MDVRKLILFGGNSYVISLPKKWVDLNKLNKGDLVYVETNKNNLIIRSEGIKTDVPKVEVTIKVDKNSRDTSIERELFGAYVKGGTKIIFTGSEIAKQANTILQLLKKYVALEVIEHTNTKILAKTYINSKEVKVPSFTRRIDNTIRSMLLDLEVCFESEKHELADLVETISQREENIDKIKRLLYRVISERLKNPLINPSESAMVNLRNWELITYLEKLSNQIRSVSQNLINLEKKEPCDDILEHVKTIKEIYELVMKAYYKEDTSSTEILSKEIKRLKTKIDKTFKDNGRDKKRLLMNILEFLRDINRITY